jgi:hypothetical protein
VPATPVRYRSDDEDSARWLGFPFRDGDIVISTRSKSGTTWVQMICALLVFRTPDLPAPLAMISPWLDWLGEPRDDVVARLTAQPHRRVIKTHTPLDGLPLDRRATYVVVARQPLDLAVSLYHQGDNLDRDRMAALTGAPPPDGDRPALDRWLRGWIDWDGEPRDQLDSLPGLLAHVGDAWTRRDEPNVVLVHYADLLADLEGEMRRLADRLGITTPEARWSALVDAARFARMRAQADRLAPDAQGVLIDRTAFFRRGSSGAGREALTAADLARYHARLRQLAPPDLIAWLDR